MNKTRVLIVEPSEIIATGLTALLREVTRFKLAEPLSTVDAVAPRLVLDRPDVVVVNPTLVDGPSALGLDAGTACVALVYQYVEPSRLRSYDGVIDIRDGVAAIVDTLTTASRAKVDDTPESHGSSASLSKREIDVLVKVAKGLTNKEIADQLNVSVHTIMSHRKNIMHKTGIKSVAGLTVYAMLNNLI